MALVDLPGLLVGIIPIQTRSGVSAAQPGARNPTKEGARLAGACNEGHIGGNNIEETIWFDQTAKGFWPGGAVFRLCPFRRRSP